jgi:RecJ-like exonuclease
MSFAQEVERASKICKSLFREHPVRVVSHNDADGLASASIMAKALLREGIKFTLKVITGLTPQTLTDLNVGGVTVFTDIGSGQLSLLKPHFEESYIVVLDHHQPEECVHPNLFHLNPVLHSADVSASEVTYLFVKNLNLTNADLVDLAIVGAVGDEYEFVDPLSARILEEAQALGAVTVSQGLRLYGRNTRPLHRTLEYSFDPLIPGVSGSESQAVQFLADLGISIKDSNGWRKLSNLSWDEQRKLASAIIVDRLRMPDLDASDIFGKVYTLPGRPPEVCDAREFATLLNACGRVGNWQLGIRICMGDVGAIQLAQQVLEEYRKNISAYLEWLKRKEACLQSKFATYVLGMDKVQDTLIGVLLSIALRSNLIPRDKPIFGLAKSEDGVKISARCPHPLQIDVREVLCKAVERIGGLAGGHSRAAGGLIPRNKVEDFIKVTDQILGETLA